MNARWWSAPGIPNNHGYKLGADGTQRCHLCGEVEVPLRAPTGDDRTARAAAHLVHGVRAHLDATPEDWAGPTADKPQDEHGRPPGGFFPEPGKSLIGVLPAPAAPRFATPHAEQET